MGTLFREFRDGGRNLFRQPAFAVFPILILAVAIGANAALFSVVDAVLLRPLSYPHQGSLVTVVERLPSSGYEKLWLTEGEERIT